MNRRKMALASAVLVIAAGGCYLGQPGTYTARPGTGGPPPASPAGSARARMFGLGASGGLFMPQDSQYDNGLATGFVWSVQASLWLSPHLALQADIGSCTLADRGDVGSDPGLGGQMTLSPVTVSAIVSVPMPMFYGMPGYGVGFGGGDFYRWRFGFGLGTMALSHTNYDVPESIDVAYFTAGAEWLVGFGDRFFLVLDQYFGEVVAGESGTDTWDWDLTYITTLKCGIEIGF